jgi:hypothetical protein
MPAEGRDEPRSFSQTTTRVRAREANPFPFRQVRGRFRKDLTRVRASGRKKHCFPNCQVLYATCPRVLAIRLFLSTQQRQK